MFSGEGVPSKSWEDFQAKRHCSEMTSTDKSKLTCNKLELATAQISAIVMPGGMLT